MFHYLRTLFKVNGLQLDETDAMKKFLIVGLGNIGDEYAATRHNIGFKILDALAEKEDFSFETKKLGDVGVFKVKGRSIICLKPSTYMNRSGKSVKYWMEKENIPLENVLVLTDDIHLSFGTLRLKTKGSDGGHNGLKDIQTYLNTTNYNRMRFGVGANFGQGSQVNYVLGEWSEEEKEALKERYVRTTELVRSFVLAGVNRTMNLFNNT
ncbi:peptidyl-tRNA hydrolase [Arenibacter certesii]|uniref:Peptidyl-tRNA hydrolase n=2 Tax=Arenibacter certesii TaxID=228955 RepID=A0A918J723_9FLAO|nr:aminoacyl-tRNA hydrolase [Arenibacter certesii]GGW48039.1 peptidyl-tRNA hydrolase [Arenibacter certesii]